MKRILLSFLVASCFPFFAQAQSRSLDVIAKSAGDSLAEQLKDKKGSVAIGDIPYGYTDQSYPIAKFLSNSISNQFINKNITVVDRAHLDKIMNEQKIQSEALFDTKTAARLGKMAGAGTFVFGRFYANYQWLRITLWAVDVQTGLIIAADDQAEPMTPSLEADVNAMVPGLTANNRDVKKYRATERVCQILKPGIDLIEVAKIYNKYLPNDPDLRYESAAAYSQLMKEEVGDKGWGTVYPSGWRFANWFVSDSEGAFTLDSDKDEKRRDIEISLSKKNRESYKTLPEKFRAGTNTGLTIKSWALMSPESVPSSPYCVPQGNLKVNNNVNSQARIPLDDGFPADQSVLSKLSIDIEAKLADKIKTLTGRLAISGFQSTGMNFPAAAVHVLEDHIMVDMVHRGFKVVDRGTLEKIVAEQKLQQSALFNPASMSKIGKLAGADYILLGSVERTPTRVILSLRIVNVATGVFAAQAEADTKNNLALDEELASLLSFDSFTHSLDDDMMSHEEFNPPAYMGPRWRDNLRRFKFGIFSDWVCSMVSPAGDVNAIVKEAFRRNLLVIDENGNVPACKAESSNDGSTGYVLRLSSGFEDIIQMTNAEWRFDVVQNIPNNFCTYDTEKKEIVFSQPLTMRAWKFEGPTGLAPGEDGGLRENCLKEGIGTWNDQRRDKKKKIR